MNRRTFSKFRTWALTGVAAAAIAGPAWAEEARQFTIPSQSLVAALEAFGKQGDKEILFSKAQAEGHATAGVTGSYEPAQALAMLLSGSGLKFRQVNDNTYVVESADPQSGSAAGDGADGTVAALIVTAQKREENVQDVPIAISAFTEKALEEQKIEGGFDLLKAIPNVTFSKNNFTSYNFSIRGIGTKAVSATTDPGVAVAFNNTPLLQNRLFEQEYFDVERVEVLRGPQGTLYGRNATAGVINVISAKPNLHEFDGWIKGEVGNYHTKRVSAMVNLPLVEDKLGIRFAGALTDRQGYDYNSVTKHHVNGRDLWSGRITVGFNPTERIRSNLIWERFNEDDNRSRTGKQLCHRDPGPTQIGGTSLIRNNPTYELPDGRNFADVMTPVLFSQGCSPGSLYNDDAFGTPNGLALPFVFGMLALGSDCGAGCSNDLFAMGYDANGRAATLLQLTDPYGGMMQSRDLRTIASFRDPVYRAKADVVELNIDVDLSDALTLSSQTAYNKDTVYSFQDFNRFNTVPIFNDTARISRGTVYDYDQGHPVGDGTPGYWADLAPGGVFCDPQLGCSNTLAGFDISRAKGEQFSQELRVQSNFAGPLNFSAGANYLRFKTLVDYYVFYNLITAYAMMQPFNGGAANPGPDIGLCSGVFGYGPATSIDDPLAICPYIDPNPIESINGEGHNYFRSKNPYRLKSAAAFGEIYWQIDDDLKLTAGLRYTDDRKMFFRIPSQILLAPGFLAGGAVNRGYPVEAPIEQHWGEWTGRLGLDWKPDLSFTDQTMVYGFYSRGYKGGGANPPAPGFASAQEGYDWLVAMYGQDYANYWRDTPGVLPVLHLTGVEYGRTFAPEFVDAFELGSKNTLLGGALTLNGDAFFYNYKDYQVSQIRDRTAVNENFDAQVWGLELQGSLSPTHNLQTIFNIGYLDTRIADGETSIDIMNRTQGNPDYILVKPWVQLPSNCIVPRTVVEAYLQDPNQDGLGNYFNLCGGYGGLLYGLNTWRLPQDPTFGGAYDPANYPEINGGAGIKDELGGNELPNAPHWTMNFGAQYGIDFADGWRATIRGDAYWQSQSWARVYNEDPYDKLHGWYNVNLSVWVERPEDGLKIEFYAKNILDKTPITDSFLNSDDTALTTNVFVLDPRLIGLSIKKEF
jgi:outer membrane receptor protein involved in Fe transport